MTSTRKLSNFRQLSLTTDSPSPHQKRRPLKKQFSEDIPDFKDPWFDQHGNDIRILLNNKNKKTEKNVTDRPPPVKIAWGDKNENISLNEEVIIKKCKEIKRTSSGKLTRHPSLEKDSILNSKQDLAERLRIKNGDKENDKTDVKPNLKIFLAHNTQNLNDNFQQNISNSQNVVDNLETSDQFLDNMPQPKYLQPLVTNFGKAKAFQIRKNVNKKPLESPKRPNFCRSNTIVVVPLIEKDKPEEIPSEETEPEETGINVIIRPMTAQSRREKFQKRTNSAFHGTSKDQPAINFRPPLVRSSSAPSTKPEKSKFLASKRKLKSNKKFTNSPKGGDKSPKNFEAKEWKNAAQTASDIVTMVSLISPSGSENEEGSDEEAKERPKSVLKKENHGGEKGSGAVVKEDDANKDVAKNVSLRRTVKSVSFQQSSIHAVRSFSASFPARRGSMATALNLGSNSSTNGCAKGSMVKGQEKRSTNPGSPDADERVPKRRLVRSNTEEKKSSCWQKATAQIGQTLKKSQEMNASFSVEIQSKSNDQQGETEIDVLESAMKLNLEENAILITPKEKKEEVLNGSIQKEEPTPETPKEKQCWAMYCKMTEKGINVSYDTILRGMLTPTEYRIRRKTSIADEMKVLVNSSVESSEKPIAIP